MQVKILTKRLKTSTLESATAEPLDLSIGEKVIDWDDSSDRKWLNNHFHWAVKNQHCVLIRPIF